MKLSELQVGQKFLVVGPARSYWADGAYVVNQFREAIKPGESTPQPVAFTERAVAVPGDRFSGGIYWPVSTPVELVE